MDRLWRYFSSLAVFLLAMSCAHLAHAGPNVYQLSLSILSYSRWPQFERPTLCVVDNRVAAASFQTEIKQLNYPFQVLSISSKDLAKQSCQAIFFSAISPAQQQSSIFGLPNRGLGVLTLSSNNVECEIGSIFCLYVRNSQYNFKVNLDALSAAKVHVDPRVLLLAKNTEATQ